MQRAQQGLRVGNTAHLDKNPPERWNASRIAVLEDLPQCGLDILSNRAAQAAAGEQYGAIGAECDHVVVESDFPQLVHDHEAVGAVGVAQQPA